MKFGYAYEDLAFKDCIAMQNGILRWVLKVDTPVDNPVTSDILESAFTMKMGCIESKIKYPNFKIVWRISVKNYMRMDFFCDGIKYVRFKRSAGSSRVGKCLFIDERLYRQMHKWENVWYQSKRRSRH